MFKRIRQLFLRHNELSEKADQEIDEILFLSLDAARQRFFDFSANKVEEMDLTLQDGGLPEERVELIEVQTKMGFKKFERIYFVISDTEVSLGLISDEQKSPVPNGILVGRSLVDGYTLYLQPNLPKVLVVSDGKIGEEYPSVQSSF